MRRGDAFNAVLYLLTAVVWFVLAADEHGAGQVVSRVLGVLLIIAALDTIRKGRRKR